MAKAPQEESSKVNVMDLFSEESRIPIQGLAFLGYHTTEVTYGGHRFGLQTLRQEFRYAIAEVVQPWRNTMFEVNVWRDAHVAAALTHIDGDRDFCNPTNDNLAHYVKGRFQYITNAKTGWYKPVLDFLYVEYQKLEAEAAKAVDELDFLSPENIEPNFSDWLGTSISADSSTVETDSDSESSVTFKDPFA